MISQEIISDEHFNALSLEAQNVFVRMLAVSDDCGVVPANIYKLNVLINTPPKLIKRIQEILDEICSLKLGIIIEHRGDRYFIFKPSSFKEYQSYILKKATKSEYLRLSVEEFEEVSSKFQEILGNSFCIGESAVSTAESRKKKVESNKQKEEREKYGESENVFLTKSEYERLCDKFTQEKTYRAISFLGSYKIEKGYKTKSDYLTLIRWVFDAIDERDGKAKRFGKSALDRAKEEIEQQRLKYDGASK